jgi:hypothetical protein
LLSRSRELSTIFDGLPSLRPNPARVLSPISDDAVELGRGGDAFGIDSEVAVVGGLEEAAEAFVANHANHSFVALLQSLIQSSKRRFARGGIVARFRLIITNDVAATPCFALTCPDLS